MSWACNSIGTTVADTYIGVGPTIYNAIQTFLAAQCIITPDLFHEPTPDVLNKIADQSYDFIIVGAGAAGAIVANRLSEISDWKILLLEAGGNPTIGTEVPQFFSNNIKSEQDWSFRTMPNENVCLSCDNTTIWPRGKVLGGSSSINYMLHVRGNREDYNKWGYSSWRYNKVLPYFKKSENLPVEYQNGIDMEYHGTGGYLSVERPTNDPFEDLMIDANIELGIPFNNDYNGETQMGVSVLFTNIYKGVRQSTVNTFLKPIQNRTNLTVIKHVTVDKVIFDGKTAIGVCAVTKNGVEFEVFASKEVILSAGTIMSPVILLKSGVGPKEDFKNSRVSNKSILPIVDLPVGKNLHEHIYCMVMYKMKNNDTLSNSLPALSKAFYQYVTENRTGPLSNLKPIRVVSFINTTDANAKTPDIQIFFSPVSPSQVDYFNSLKGVGFGDNFINQLNKINQDHSILIVLTTLLQPKSRGSIKLDENNNPEIHAGSLSLNEDKETLLRGVKHSIKFADTKAFKELGFELHWTELEACRNLDKTTEEYLRCYIRHVSYEGLHATGTNKMASDETGVVDETLKVKYLESLRVIDLSIAPLVPSGNSVVSAMMIGERGADLIKKTWLQC